MDRRWPVEQADVWVVSDGQPVAVSTLGDPDLARLLAARAPAGLNAAAPTATENIGIEKLVRNVIANPAVRVLVVGGPDTGGTAPTGHYAGDALVQVVAAGVDPATMRIVGARGRRPFLKNVSIEEVEAFRRQVTLVDRRGLTDLEALVAAVEQAGADADGAAGVPGNGEGVLVIGRAASPVVAVEPIGAGLRCPYVADPVGYVLVFADHPRHRLLLEHYASDGRRTAVLAGEDPAALAEAAIARGLVGRLDHAAYLGRELQRAAEALDRGVPYVQDG